MTRRSHGRRNHHTTHHRHVHVHHGPRRGGGATVNNRAYMGRAFRKGDEVWVNIGWNTAGQQLVPKIVPDLLKDCVSEGAYKSFAEDIEKAAAENALPAYTACLMILSIYICVLLPVFCWWMKSKKSRFDGAIQEVVDRHKHKFSNALSWKLVQFASGGDMEAALGYNLVFNLAALGGGGGGGGGAAASVADPVPAPVAVAPSAGVSVQHAQGGGYGGGNYGGGNYGGGNY